MLWVSYYSAHEGKCEIYLAKVAIDTAGAAGTNVNPEAKTKALDSGIDSPDESKRSTHK